MSVRKRGLGRGLDALLGSANAAQTGAEVAEELRDLPLEQLQPGRHQPRRHFDETALQELAASIAAQGVIQPIVARPLPDGRYEIVAGERRWRAAGLAGLSSIPAVVRRLDDRTAMAVAVVENIQRADLNAMEEAEGLQRLVADCGLTHEQVAQALGRSRVSVTNLLRVLDLHEELRGLLRAGRLSLGHAKVLLGAPLDRQPALAAQVVALALTVRQTESLLQRSERVTAAEAGRPSTPSMDVEYSRRLGLPVKLRPGRSGGGSITIRYRSGEDLERLFGRFS